MAERPYWAWLQHQHEEVWLPMNVLDNEHNLVYNDSVNLDQEKYLPAVLMKAMYDKSPARPAWNL